MGNHAFPQFQSGLWLDATRENGSLSTALRRLAKSYMSEKSVAAERPESQESFPANAQKRPKDISAKLIDSQEAERKRIARELHDGVGQLLTCLNLQIEQCMDTIRSSDEVQLPSGTRESLEALPLLVQEAINEVRGICKAIRPPMLDDLGLMKAISWQCRTSQATVSGVQIETEFHITESEMPDHLKVPVYRIVQEALNNAIKHSRARHILIKLGRRQGEIRLAIIDDGVGYQYDPQVDKGEEAQTGMGHISMRERAETSGGRFRIETGVGEGYAVFASWPG